RRGVAVRSEVARAIAAHDREPGDTDLPLSSHQLFISRVDVGGRVARMAHLRAQLRGDASSVFLAGPTRSDPALERAQFSVIRTPGPPGDGRSAPGCRPGCARARTRNPLPARRRLLRHRTRSPRPAGPAWGIRPG